MELDPRQPVCLVCGGEIRHWGSKHRRGQTYEYDRCKDCGFAFVNPRPSMAALAEHYSAPIADGSEKVPAVTAAVPGEKREIGWWPGAVIRQLTTLRAGPGMMLDIGAADGAYCIAALRAGLSVTALEIDPVDLPALRAAGEIRIVQSLFEEFDATPGAFDYILMSHVLEHVHDPAAWIEKAARLLSEGGVLAVMLPHFDSLWRYLWGTGDPYFIPPDHLNHFTARSLDRVCDRFGLKTAKAYSETRLPEDVVSKRLPAGSVLRPVVRAATRAGSVVLDGATRIMGMGSVLIHYGVKR